MQNNYFKPTWLVLVLFLPAWLAQLNAQTYTGDNLGAGISSTNPTTVSTVTVPTSGTIGSGATLDAVMMDITHTFDGDLDIFLIAPDGTSLEMTTDNGGSGDNYTMTVFEDGNPSIAGGAAPFTGTFQPEGGTFASAFDGVCITGDWRLEVTDDASGDIGTLNNFMIQFTTDGAACGVAPPTFTCTGSPTGYPGDNAGSPIIDVGTIESVITVGGSGTIGVDAAIESLELDLTHTFDSDLDIFLISPAGTSLELSTDNGGSGNNYTGTVFQDGALPITNGSAPFNGTFRPEGGNFASTFNGETITGDWILRISDDLGGDTGTFIGTTLNICSDNGGGSGPYVCMGPTTNYTGDNAGSPIIDIGTIESVITVGGSGTIGVDAAIESLELDLTHTFDSDLDIFLISPAGTSLELSTDNGGSGNNYTGTVFQDGALPITNGSAPFNGTFRPEGGNFASTFNGETITGDWILRISDDLGGDTGTFIGTTLNICSDGVVDPCIGETDPPTVACNELDVEFNGEATIDIAGLDLYNASGSSDACGGVSFLGPITETVSCLDVGQDIMVLVEAIDDNGNIGSCMATITVGGLPCDWTDSDGIGCSGDAEYDATEESFTLNSTDCSAAFPYVADQVSFAYQDICGDVTIIAEVTNVSANAYGGIMIREDGMPGARKMAIATNTIDRLLKEVRVAPNYPAFPQQSLSYDKFWLKIEKSNGFLFKGSVSVDGVNYIPFINQAIQMSACTQVGLYVYSTDGSAASASFENVSITTALPLEGTPNTIAQSNAHIGSAITLYPNPTNSEVNLNMDSYFGERVDIRIFNATGQLMTQRVLDAVESDIETFDVSTFTPGMYWIRVVVDGQQETLKLIVE